MRNYSRRISFRNGLFSPWFPMPKGCFGCLVYIVAAIIMFAAICGVAVKLFNMIAFG